MSSNVGLTTPRGSGTSGYVQRNLSALKPRSTGAGAPYTLDAARGPQQRKPDQAILTHDRLREIEVHVLEHRDTLEDEGKLDDDEIDAACDKLRVKMLAELDGKKKKNGRGADNKGRGIKGYQVHELAEAKAVESAKLRRALGLRADEAPADGDADEHPMARQERKRKEREMERAKVDVEREERQDRDERRERSLS